MTVVKSCSLRFDASLSPEECAFALRGAGFTHTFATYGYRDEGIRDVAAAHAAGLTVETLHAAYGGCNEMWLDDLRGESRTEFYLSCVRATAMVGVPAMILHLSSGDAPPPPCELGARRYARVCKEAERLGVAIAFENLRKTAYLRYIFERIDSPARKFCFDCGHEHLYDEGDGVLEEFAHALCAVHLHDNFGVHDDHVLPFEGTVDWKRLCIRLNRIGFSLPITLELKAPSGGLSYAKKAFDAACKIEQLLTAN